MEGSDGKCPQNERRTEGSGGRRSGPEINSNRRWAESHQQQVNPRRRWRKRKLKSSLRKPPRPCPAAASTWGGFRHRPQRWSPPQKRDFTRTIRPRLDAAGARLQTWLAALHKWNVTSPPPGLEGHCSVLSVCVGSGRIFSSAVEFLGLARRHPLLFPRQPADTGPQSECHDCDLHVTPNLHPSGIFFNVMSSLKVRGGRSRSHGR